MVIGRPSDHSTRSLFWSGVVIATVIGGWLRFAGLGNRDFWYDESCTFLYVHNLFDWPEDSNLLVESTNLPYYVLLRGWGTLFGDSEAAYRSLSALAATLVIPLIGLFARRIAGTLAGIVAAVLVAIQPLHIHYAHEARAYALWSLALTALIYLIFEASTRTSKKWWLGYGLVLWGCLHLHYYTAFWIPASFACVFIADQRAKVAKQWLVTTAIVGIGFLPYFFAAVLPAAGGGGGAWIADHWSGLRDALGAIPHSLWAFLPAGAYPVHLTGLSVAPGDAATSPWWPVRLSQTVPAIIVCCTFLVLILGKSPAAKGDTEPSGQPRIHLFLGTLTLAPLVLALLYSVLGKPIYLAGRYDLVAWPAFVVWVAVGIAQAARSLSPHRAGLIAAVICLPLVASAVVPIKRMANFKADDTIHKARANRIAQLTEPGDLTVVFSYDREYLSYYLHRAGFDGELMSYPSWLDSQVGWVDTEADLSADVQKPLADDAMQMREHIGSVLDAGHQVYVVSDFFSWRGPSRRTPINHRLIIELDTHGYRVDLIEAGLRIMRAHRTDETP